MLNSITNKIQHHSELKNSVDFNRTMFEHYEALHNSFLQKMMYMKAYFAGYKMNYYYERMEQSNVDGLLLGVNKNKKVIITLPNS